MKKVLLIPSIHEKNGNSELLCLAFAQETREAGHAAELVSLREKTIHVCRGCHTCVKTGKSCVQKDDTEELIEKALAADVLVLAPHLLYVCQRSAESLSRPFHRRGTSHMPVPGKVSLSSHRSHCPQHIDIRTHLKTVSKKFDGFQGWR